jgi:2'-5' RNA ligase
VVRDQLQRASETIAVEGRARRVPRNNLHLTLHFIGNVTFAQMACLQGQARLVKGELFDLSIDCQGHFGKPRVAWLGCQEIPATLVELHALLGQNLEACDYRPEARRYNPHVTVARKISPINTVTAFDSITWPVEDFSLVEVRQLQNGVQYHVIETFPLT